MGAQGGSSDNIQPSLFLVSSSTMCGGIMVVMLAFVAQARSECSVVGCAWAGGLCMEVGGACDAVACRGAYKLAHLQCKKNPNNSTCSVAGCTYFGGLCMDVGSSCDAVACREAYKLARLHCKPPQPPRKKSE